VRQDTLDAQVERKKLVGIIPDFRNPFQKHLENPCVIQPGMCLCDLQEAFVPEVVFRLQFFIEVISAVELSRAAVGEVDILRLQARHEIDGALRRLGVVVGWRGQDEIGMIRIEAPQGVAGIDTGIRPVEKDDVVPGVSRRLVDSRATSPNSIRSPLPTGTIISGDGTARICPTTAKLSP
jgi:hypothetical protein